MGYFSEVEQELRERAFELGDQQGEREEIVQQLCTEFNLDREQILNILQGDCDDYEPDCDDSDDGYALASAGFGMDEDYGYADEVY